jgi:hypothetical protein
MQGMRALRCGPAFVAVFAVAQAIAIAPDLGLDTAYRYVGECGGGSGTAISPHTMITAKHVPGITFGVGGKIFTAVERINHPDYDLAIFNFAEVLPGWYQLGTSAPIGAPVVWVGYGGVGYVNNQWHGYDIWYGNHGRHSAANVVHRKWSMFGLGPALVSMLVDNPNSAGINGDSGGAVFSNGRLVGVISYAFQESGGQLPNYGFAMLNGGVAYHGSGAIDLTLPEIRNWVLSNMDPPFYKWPRRLLPLRPAPAPSAQGWPLELPFFRISPPTARP